MTMHARGILERIFGYSQPVVLADGNVEYRCAFCDAGSGPAAEPHHPTCSYWQAIPLFDGPIGRSLVERWAAASV